MTETYCDVCNRRDSWGCGHTLSQRRDARRHACDPATCKLAQVPPPAGYAPFVKHADAA